MDLWLSVPEAPNLKTRLEILSRQWRVCTHVDKAGLPLGPEVPLDVGVSFHLAPPLAGDAAQLEALPHHGLGVRVHLCTGAIAPVHCLQNRGASVTVGQT